MLRGRPMSTVLPVRASMLATVSESGRRPQRPAPESPPSRSTLKRPSWAPTTAPSPNIVSMNWRCTSTMWAPKSSAPATVSERRPLTPTTASRCWRWSPRGCPRRQASMKRRAQPTARAIRPRRSTPSSSVLEAAQKTKECAKSATTALSRVTTTTAIQIRVAIRPMRRLPATSWAEPGMTRVITIRVTARRNRTRCARSAVLERPASAVETVGAVGSCGGASGCDPLELSGGMGCLSCWGKSARPVSPVPPVTSRYDAPGGRGWPPPTAAGLRPPAASRRTPPTTGRRRRAGRRRASAASSTAPTVSRSMRPWTRCACRCSTSFHSRRPSGWTMRSRPWSSVSKPSSSRSTGLSKLTYQYRKTPSSKNFQTL